MGTDADDPVRPGLELGPWRDDDLVVRIGGRAVVAAATATGRHRLWATVREWNAASFRVLDRIRFERTGRVDVDEFGESVRCTRRLD